MNDTLEYYPERGIYRAEFSAQSAPPSLAIVRAIARIEDTHPKKIDVLYDVIDPDALDSLVLTSPTTHGDIHVSITFQEYRVTVHSYGLIEIHPLDPGGAVHE